ncbi:MAG: tRNA (pseudouridine(54)-N(1))-methyltransferase TrmY [Methanobacteriota archaeon]
MRRFLVIGHRARTTAPLPLDDLGGAGGRWDVLVRCVNAALFVSHGLRRDSEIHLLLLGPPEPPRVVRVEGAKLRHANPDERSLASLLSKALATPAPGPVFMEASPGVSVARMDLAEVLERIPGPWHLLVEDGTLLAAETGRLGGPGGPGGPGGAGGDVGFVIGDDRGFTLDEEAFLRARCQGAFRLGPVSLQAEHAIVVVHTFLDVAREQVAGSG